MSVRVFGNGSLINKESLESTCPKAKIIAPAKVYGWQRHLNICLLGSQRTENGIAPTAVSADPGTDNDWLNGVLIELSYEEMAQLRVRECFYNTVKLEVFDYFDNKSLGNALMWIVVDYPKAPCPWEHPRTLPYIKLCLEGCLSFGKKYFEDFLDTTYIDGKKMIEHDYVQKIVNELS